MRSRIKAIKVTVNSAVKVVELGAAISFVTGAFSENGFLGSFCRDVGAWLSGIGGGSSPPGLNSTSIRGPAIFLSIVLACMLSGLFLIPVFPREVERREKQLEDEEWD